MGCNVVMMWMIILFDVTFKIMAPPVEWPKQKQGSAGFSAKTLLRNIFYTEYMRGALKILFYLVILKKCVLCVMCTDMGGHSPYRLQHNRENARMHAVHHSHHVLQ